ncbi:MAG: ABC transporter ATP-binding protein [Candidatus Lokiarchaeota archaeon]|nr:ABC transporter ATP-binding protein [Candidatus Lokiarchaeota archaeon]
MNVSIELENLSKVFYNKQKKIDPREKEIWALDGVSFSVNEGEIFGLLGPNGAGKTTTIRCIAGVLQPTKGVIWINGKEIGPKQHEARKKMGFLTENHGSYEHLTVYNNLKFFGSFYGIDDGYLEKRIDEVLDEIGLGERKHMKAGKLSKGQKQRLAIARAILHDPQFVFFDEPTSGLDPVASVKVRELILGLKHKNRTLFINSHNLDEVQKICDRVAILDLGKIKRIGTPNELRKDLFKSQEVVCTLKNVISEGIEQSLKQLEHVKQFRIEGNEIHLFLNDIDETTPIVVEQLVKHGAKILEIKRKIQSLEDIYMKLMKNDEKNQGDK